MGGEAVDDLWDLAEASYNDHMNFMKEYKQTQEMLKQPETKYKFVRDTLLNYIYKKDSKVKGNKIRKILDEYKEYLDLTAYVKRRSHFIKRDQVKKHDKYLELNKKFSINGSLDNYIYDYDYHEKEFTANNAELLVKYVSHVKEKVQTDKEYEKNELKEVFDFFFKENDEFYIKKVEEHIKKIRGPLNKEFKEMDNIYEKEGLDGLAKHSYKWLKKEEEKLGKSL